MLYASSEHAEILAAPEYLYNLYYVNTPTQIRAEISGKTQAANDKRKGTELVGLLGGKVEEASEVEVIQELEKWEMLAELHDLELARSQLACLEQVLKKPELIQAAEPKSDGEDLYTFRSNVLGALLFPGLAEVMESEVCPITGTCPDVAKRENIRSAIHIK